MLLKRILGILICITVTVPTPIIDTTDLVFTDGDISQVTCRVGESHPLPTVAWYIDGTPQPTTSITTTSNSDNTTTTSILRYRADKADNKKPLQCTASNDIGDPKTDTLTLDVRYLPVVNISGTSNIIILQGRQLVLKCVTDSNPVVRLTDYIWKRNGAAMQGHSSSKYRIDTVDKSHGGRYTCMATNTVGSTTSSPKLVDIIYGPTVTVSSPYVTVKEHSGLELTCTVTSNPVPSNFIWKTPDGRIESANQQLNIININRNQTGVYTCVANNTLNPTDGNSETRSDSKTTTVNVQYVDPIKISTDEVEEGGQINITCSTNSHPVASMTWFNGSDHLQTLQANTGSYIKAEADCLDTNIYNCTAVNDAFDPVDQIVELLVTCQPRQDPRVTPKHKVVGKIPGTVNLVADILSYPTPSFNWFYIEDEMRIPIHSSGSYQQTNIKSYINTYQSTLTINMTSTAFYRQYHLTATNGDDIFHLFTFELLAQTVPDDPTSATVKQINSTNMCVEWKAGFNGGDPQSFIVQHSTDNITWVDSSPIPDGADGEPIDYCITDLTPDTSYNIRMVARNKFGTGQTVYFTTSDGTDGIQTAAAVTVVKEDDYASGVAPGYNSGLAADVGIGIGAMVVVVLLVIGSIYLYRRYKTGKTGEPQPDENYDTLNRVTSGSPTYQELNIVNNGTTADRPDVGRQYENHTLSRDGQPYDNRPNSSEASGSREYYNLGATGTRGSYNNT